VSLSPTPACPLLTALQQELQDSITIEALYTHAEALQALAYSTPGRNRVAGSEGHNLTVEYITSQLAALGDYYTVEVQPWEGFTQQFGEAFFSVNGVEYETQVVEFSPNATVPEAPVAIVPNLGCDAVRSHPATHFP
jgi:carboxypeptidase Q